MRDTKVIDLSQEELSRMSEIEQSIERASFAYDSAIESMENFAKDIIASRNTRLKEHWSYIVSRDRNSMVLLSVDGCPSITIKSKY